MSLSSHIKNIRSLKKKAKPDAKIGLVSGIFNVIHPGHLRLFKFAVDLCDILIVVVNDDDTPGVLVPQELRLENLQSLTYIDYCFISQNEISEIIKKIRPEIVVKGKEYEDRFNPEQEALNAIGGKLLFNSGETVFSSTHLINQETQINLSGGQFIQPENYLKRHKLKAANLLKAIEGFKNKNILVIGDLIIDEYITCDALGLSQEDPTVVVTPVDEKRYIGGAGIVASHARQMGAKTTFVSVCGDDGLTLEAEEMLKAYDVKAYLYRDDSRPTTLKKRYRSKGKTLLRVSKIRQHDIESTFQKKILSLIKKNIKDLELIIFSDFNYGVLPQNLVDHVIDIAVKNNVKIVADSQSSSQVGDISRFNNMQLITPTELEARIAVKDHHSGLIGVAHALAHKSNPDNMFLTLGDEGSLILKMESDLEEDWVTDRLPALSKNAKDTAGAGDAMLVSSSLSLLCGCTIWEAALIGAIASACQVSRVGNTPLQVAEMEKAVKLVCAG